MRHAMLTLALSLYALAAAAQPGLAGQFDARILEVGAGVVTYRLDTTTGETEACVRVECLRGDRLSGSSQAPGTYRLIPAPDRIAVLDTRTGKLYVCNKIEANRQGKPIVTGGGTYNCT